MEKVHYILTLRIMHDPFFSHLPGDPKRQIEKIEEDNRDRFS